MSDSVLVFERYLETDDDGEGHWRADSGWVPRTSYKGATISQAEGKMTAILSEQYPAVPDKLLFVHVESHTAIERDVKPVGVQLIALDGTPVR